MSSLPIYSHTWGHEMIPMDIPGAQECKNCGVHYIDEFPCPSSPVCACSGKRSGFTFLGHIAGTSFYGCADCGLPTSFYLQAVIDLCVQRKVTEDGGDTNG